METPSKIRTRFAPSPTGFVHIGSLRTALFSFLFARHNGGVNILRVEDTDQNRLIEGAIENLVKVFADLGVTFDEGFYLDDQNRIGEQGSHGPYLQSKRLDLYQQYAQQLIEQGSAYYCFCSEVRLEEVRKEQIALKKPPMYDRHCRNLTADEVSAKLNEFKTAGKNPVIRQAIPLEGSVTYHDLIFGDITIENKILDDQILLKSDKYPTYHLAVVVDDHLMEISHTIRGEEYLSSTPKHVLLYQTFGWDIPQFIHLPLILNPDKSKLSKRQGDVAVEDFLRKGYLTEALVNFVAFLGWNPKTEQEMFTIEGLITQFDLKNINKAAAIFDINKLDWMNGLYIRSKSLDELTNLLIPYWTNAAYIEEATSTLDDLANHDQFTISAVQKDTTIEYLQAITALEQDRLKKLSEIGERTAYFFKDPEYDSVLLIWKKSNAQDAKDKLSRLHNFFADIPDDKLTKENLEAELKSFISDNAFDTGSVLWPLRVALTGMEKSPGPFEVAATLALGLGKGEILKRIQAAKEKLP